MTFQGGQPAENPNVEKGPEAKIAAAEQPKESLCMPGETHDAAADRICNEAENNGGRCCDDGRNRLSKSVAFQKKE